MSESLFESHSVLVVTGNVARAASTRAIFVKSFMHGFQDVFVATHAQIVIGAPHRDSLVFGGRVGTREFFGKAIDVVEVAVGFVLMLFVELAGVKRRVIEFGNRWRGRLRPSERVGLAGVGLGRRMRWC